MISINQYITEQQSNQKINAPTMAYITLYGKYPLPPIRGHEISHIGYTIQNVQIDKHIPENAINELFNIKQIETRSSCEGQDKRHPTFLILRLKDQTESAAKIFVNNISKYKDIKSSYDKGMQGKFRICITSNLWYSLNNINTFNTWWLELPNKIKKSL